MYGTDARSRLALLHQELTLLLCVECKLLLPLLLLDRELVSDAQVREVCRVVGGNTLLLGLPRSDIGVLEFVGMVLCCATVGQCCVALHETLGVRVRMLWTILGRLIVFFVHFPRIVCQPTIAQGCRVEVIQL